MPELQLPEVNLPEDQDFFSSYDGNLIDASGPHEFGTDAFSSMNQDLSDTESWFNHQELTYSDTTSNNEASYSVASENPSITTGSSFRPTVRVISQPRFIDLGTINLSRKSQDKFQPRKITKKQISKPRCEILK